MKMRFIMLLSLCLFVIMSWMNCDNSKKKISQKSNVSGIFGYDSTIDSNAVKKYMQDHNDTNHSKIEFLKQDPFNKK